MNHTMTERSCGRIGFISLGCPKALVDSERILTLLQEQGYQIGAGYADADIIIINTCGFIEDAVEESLQTIEEALERNGKVIVTGCLGAKSGLVQEHFPELLAITGPHAAQEVVQAVHRHLPPAPDPHLHLLPATGVKLTPTHYAYLKISEGCNHRCRFCIIPALRGDLVSRPLDEVLDEAQRLKQAGVRELLVISQDTSAYGVDLKYRSVLRNGRTHKTRVYDLAYLLGELDLWVRLHYVYPYPHVDELIPLMADGRLLPYLDVPLQHASPKILKAMRRPANAENSLQRIRRWRRQCPELKIRSTFIVGFPGETEEDFELLLEFLRQAQLDRVGCFQYSPVEGASANTLPGAVADEVKHERHRRFMQTQAEISAARLQAMVGRRLSVLIDQVDTRHLVGRSYGEAPGIDGVVVINRRQEDTVTAHCRVGDFLEVEVIDADEHDLYAQPVAR